MKQNFYEKCIRWVRHNTNNKGASLVLVIVTIAFISSLVSMTAFMSFYNYNMKTSDKNSKDNFYSAEEAMDEIAAGLQTVVSNAMAVAYVGALQENTTVDLRTRQLYFEQKYEQELINALKLPDDENHYDVNILAGYLIKTRARAGAAGVEIGAKLLTNPATNENTIFKKNGGIVLQNVKVMYTDEKGYVTYITTDIRLLLPDISLAASSGVPDIENCSIIANKNLEITANNAIDISGNVYGGEEGMLVSGDTNLTFKRKDNDSESTLYKLVAGKVTVQNSTTGADYALRVTDNYDLWTEDIVVDSGKMDLEGSSFVLDDLTIEGKNSKVTLAGNYYGYGDELYYAKGSSSILVNGAGTTLDFSRLSNLMLSGHAYIGARHYDVNLDDDYVENVEDIVDDPSDLYSKNTKDLMMGESIGVKSNQLMYLVPKECIGFYKDTTELYLGKNPITYDEYLTLTQTYQYELNDNGEIRKDNNGNPIPKVDASGNPLLKYDEVNLGIVMSKTGQTITAAGATYKTVFRKVNGTILVYYYLDFGSEKAANEFFRLYYENDKDGIDSYVKTYINDIKVNNSLSELNANLHLAGNMVKFDNAGDVVLVEDTIDEDASIADALSDNREKWESSFKGYSAKMVADATTLTEVEEGRSIYENLVIPDAELSGYVRAGNKSYFENGATKALVVNNRDDSTPTTIGYGDVSGGVHMVIATGDLILDTNFNGLILCEGTVKLGKNCNKVTSDPIEVRKAMSAKIDATNYVADLFLDNSAYLTGTETSTEVGGHGMTELEDEIAREDDYIKVNDLIVYEKWTKH